MEQAAGLTAELLQTAEKYGMFERGDRVLVALSGGADSVALALALSESADRLDVTVCAAHLNHGLRGDESDGDEGFVRAFCAARGIPLEAGFVRVAEIAAARGGGIEETARSVRYDFLRQAAERLGCTRIATAHTADDNAETILFHLVRGTGIRGLGGIPPVRGSIVRPLIRTSRAEVERYLAVRGAAYRKDSSNNDLAFTRNRIRHQIIPLLKEINPSLEAGLADVAELLRADADCLDALTEAFLAGSTAPAEISVDRLLALPAALQGRVIRRLNADAGGASLTKAHTDAILSIASGTRPSARVSLPGGIEALRVYGTLRFAQSAPPLRPEEIALAPGGSVRFGKWRVTAETVYAGQTQEDFAEYRQDTADLDISLLAGGITVREKRPGDTFRSAARGWTKTLKKLYIEAGIPRGERACRPVVACSGGVCAVPGFGADGRYAAAGYPALRIRFTIEK